MGDSADDGAAMAGGSETRVRAAARRESAEEKAKGFGHVTDESGEGQKMSHRRSIFASA